MDTSRVLNGYDQDIKRILTGYDQDMNMISTGLFSKPISWSNG